jgi:hypothetical protein
MPRALTRDPQCAILSPKTTPPPCLPRVFTHRALTLLRTAETSKLKGRELNAPCPEAPRSACYTSTPSRALSGACSVGSVTGLQNSRFWGQPVAEATRNPCDVLFYTLFAVRLFLQDGLYALRRRKARFFRRESLVS